MTLFAKSIPLISIAELGNILFVETLFEGHTYPFDHPMGKRSCQKEAFFRTKKWPNCTSWALVWIFPPTSQQVKSGPLD